MKNNHFIYSLPGRLLRGFICLAAFGVGVAASIYILYGVAIYGTDILTATSEERYIDTGSYQQEVLDQIQYVLNHLGQATADEEKLKEVTLVDVSASEIYTYDLEKIYEESYDGINMDIQALDGYRKSYEHLDDCNMTDYNRAKAFLNDDALEDAYIYFSKSDFRALFFDQGIQNSKYRFSENFPDDAYFLFDYKGNSKTTRKILEEIEGLKEQSSDNTYDLTDINYAVYCPADEVYYSTKDDYFEAYEAYIYSVKEVKERLNELDADGTRYDSIVFALLQSENKADSWLLEPYDQYAGIIDARNNLKTKFSTDKGQFFYISYGDKTGVSDETILDEMLGKKKSGNTESFMHTMENYLEDEGYIYYAFLWNENEEFVVDSNGVPLINDDIVNSMMSDLQGTESKLLVYGFYNGDEYLEDNWMQKHIRDYGYYRSNIRRLFQLVIGMVILTLLFALWLMGTTGRRYRGDKEVSLNLYDKMPSEIWFAVSILIVTVVFGVMGSLLSCVDGSELIDHRIDLWIGVMAGIELFAYTIMLLVLSFCRRLKAHVFWKNSLLYYLLHPGRKKKSDRHEDPLSQNKEANRKDGFLNKMLTAVKKTWKSLLGLIRETVSNMKGTIRLLIIFVIYGVINILLVEYAYTLAETDGGVVLLSMVVQIVALVCVLLLIRDTNRLIDGVSEIVKGNLDHKIETDSKIGIYKELTDNINHIGDGLKKAIETSIKDERMKTELITNVSHDLKTPLTSIINYINLLKTEKMPTKDAEHYVEVLDGKAQRLKQLTDDLVEAAKATSGNIELNMMPLTFNELMSQSIGEFEDKFSKKNLSIVAHYPDDPVSILADGRRMYRVLENVFQNVYKYAMPGTRVYIDLLEKEDILIFEVKNVSEAPLNIRPEELMERFTRGDASRTTEGSGLGLSIAKDLTCLQGGTFDIILDGDLFKVVIAFPKLDKKEE